MSTIEERQRKAAQNQSLFREINERIEPLNETFAYDGERCEWLCECADPTCTDKIELTIIEYETLRGGSNSFAVKATHVFADVEDVIAVNDRYLVVAKVEAGAREADALDTRSRA
jgi:hypothetical protein